MGVLAKNKRWLTAKNKRFRSLLILLLSVESTLFKEKIVKNDFTEELSVHTNSESFKI